MTTQPTHSVIVKAHILQDAKILLLKRQEHDDEYGGYWDIPGGRLHLGEGPLDGLRREVTEETGLSFPRARPLTTWSYTPPGHATMVGISYLIKEVSGEVRLSEEHTAFEWITREALDTFPLAENLRKEIQWLLKGS